MAVSDARLRQLEQQRDHLRQQYNALSTERWRLEAEREPAADVKQLQQLRDQLLRIEAAWQRAEEERLANLERDENLLCQPQRGLNLLSRLPLVDAERRAIMLRSAATYAREVDDFATVPAGDLRLLTLPRYLGIPDGPAIRESSWEKAYVLNDYGHREWGQKEVFGPPELNPPKFSFEASQLPASSWAYRYEKQPPDLKLWLDRQADIERYLGRPVLIRQLDAHHIEVVPRIQLPAVIPFDPTMLKVGHIFFGYDTLTGEPIYAPLAEYLNTFAFGRNGGGKSMFLNHIMLSLLFNAPLLGSLTLIDLKGLEFPRYEGLLPGKLTVTYQLDHLPELISKLRTTMADSEKRLRAARQLKATTDFHFVIIDEYAPIELYKPPKADKAQKERFDKLHSDLLLLVTQGRAAGIRLWAQLQQPVDDMMNTALRSQLHNKVGFKVPNLNASAIFECPVTDLPMKPSDLPPFHCILALDGQPKRIAKAPYVPHDFDLAAIVARGAAAAAETSS